MQFTVLIAHKQFTCHSVTRRVESIFSRLDQTENRYLSPLRSAIVWQVLKNIIVAQQISGAVTQINFVHFIASLLQSPSLFSTSLTCFLKNSTFHTQATFIHDPQVQRY